MNDLRDHMKSFHDHRITLLLTLSFFQDDRMPLGRGRNHLDDAGNMLPTKADLANAPGFDAEFTERVAEVRREFGWPKGPLTAVQLWNEPWEGLSISGWGADMPRYREMYSAMAEGVLAARADGAEVLLAGCDSSSNTLDKLIPDDDARFLPLLDAVTIHYQGLWSPALYKKWRNRQGPHGRVKIWDTESWVANTDDRVAAVIASCRAAGYDRAMGIFHGNVAGAVRRRVRMPDGAERNVDMPFPWSPAAAVGAARHFIGERPFRAFVFPNGLPWVMRFDGPEDAPDAGTLVVVGDLGDVFEADMLPFRQVRGLNQAEKEAELGALESCRAAGPLSDDENRDLEARRKTIHRLTGGKMTIANPDGEFGLFDFYGNPVAGQPGAVEVPLDTLGYFLCADPARAGSFERLVEAVKAADIRAYRPVDIVARDFLAPIAPDVPLRLTLTNVLNRPVAGTLSVAVPGLEFAAPERLTLAAGESADVLVPLTGGTARPDNLYPLRARFDAAEDGASEHAEDLRVNLVACKTIRVDGRLDEWAGVPHQPVSAPGGARPSLTEAAWLPMAPFPEATASGQASAFLAHDDAHFYFAAKIADATPDEGTLRFATRDDDEFFYPEYSYGHENRQIMWKEERAWTNPAKEALAPRIPGGENLHRVVWVGGLHVADASFALDLDIPIDRPRRVSFYFLDWERGERNGFVVAQERDTGRELARAHVRTQGGGHYWSMVLAGKLRIKFVSTWSPGLALAGPFFDAPGDGAPMPGAADPVFARRAGEDRATGGRWIGHYGADGWVLPGLGANLSEDIRMSWPEYKERKVFRWPEGVRRYSYRKRPPLPFTGSDNVQLAFNVVPAEREDDMIPTLPGVPFGFIPYKDTDHEYALNAVAPRYGGGTEIWRAGYPGLPEKHFYPRQPKHRLEGPVEGGQLVVRRDGGTRIVEAAIPWTELPLVKQAVDEGRPVKLTFRINDSRGPSMELARGRSASKLTTYALKPRWGRSWTNEIEFAFEKP